MRRGIVLSLMVAPAIVIYWLQSMGASSSTVRTAAAAPDEPVDCTRLVSLAPSITEILFAAGLGPKVVGVTRYCAYPETVKSLSKVGGYVDPSLEAIVTLDPTLVVLLSEHTETLMKLKTLGLNTLTVANRRVDDILQAIETVGRVCGSEAAAARVLADLNRRITAVTAASDGRARPKVMVAMGRNMGAGGLEDIYIAGEESYYQDLIEMAGGRNAYTGKVPFPLMSREGMMQIDPDVIIDMVPDMTAHGWTEAVIKREWQTLPVTAVRKERVHVFDAPYSVVPGPRFILTLEAMADVIHPDTEACFR